MIRTRLQGDVPFFPNMLNNGKGVCDMAKEACNFVKATGFIPVDSAFGSDLREIEPKVSRDALQEQQARLEAQGMKYIPPKRERADF